MKVTGLVAATALVGGLAAVPALAEDVTLEFVVWNYSLETVLDNVAQFEAENPGIKVNVTDYSWPDYNDSLILRIRSNTPTDVVYGGQDWLPAWASAGFIAPLSTVAPEEVIDDLAGDIAGFALSDVSYNGEVYGLPYYSDTISFIYNKQILENAGIAVPQTWDEVMAAAEQLQAGGMDKPIIYEYDQELPNFYDAFVAQAYGDGAEMFDADLNPLFADPDNAAYQHLEWLADAWSRGLVQPDPHESTIIPAMNTGNHAFTIVYTYVLAALNDAATQPLAGQFAMAPMPGSTHETLGFAKSYVITSTAAADSARGDAAWRFIEFMAGRPYAIAKRWAIEKGLGFGQLPLFEDADVMAAWGEWADVTALGEQASIARAGDYTEYSSIWAAYFRPLLAQAMVGETPVADVMAEGAQRWNDLREQLANR